MSYSIAEHNSWRGGYAAVAMIQFALVIILFITLPLWERVTQSRETDQLQNEAVTDQDATMPLQPEESGKGIILCIRGVKPTLMAFLFYCGAEVTVGLWGASFLVGTRNIKAETAAGWISFYYAGITAGRLITGFIALKVHNRLLIRCGQLIAVTGGILLLLPLPAALSLVGFILIGLGLAPIFPGLLHETPNRFGSDNSAKLMGYQMAVAYAGSTFLSPLFGLIAAQAGIALFPFIVLAYLILMWMCVEKVNHVLNKSQNVRI
jgi:Fucose permease